MIDRVFAKSSRPEKFTPDVHVAGVFCEWKGRFLFLERAETQPQGGTWCVPAGKMEEGESVEETLTRELSEEAGITFSSPQSVGELYVTLPETQYLFHMFHVIYDEPPEVTLNHEHTAYAWLTLEEALSLSLIAGGKEAIEYFTQAASK